MRDVSGAIRKKYFELLNGVITYDSIAVPVYNKYLPNTITAPYYIVIDTISSVNIATKTSHITDTSVQLSIFTKDTTANSGKAVDYIADQIYQIIWPYPNAKISLEPDFQVVFQTLANDNSQTALQTNTAIYLNRFITFSHKIYHRQADVSI